MDHKTVDLKQFVTIETKDIESISIDATTKGIINLTRRIVSFIDDPNLGNVMYECVIETAITATTAVYGCIDTPLKFKLEDNNASGFLTALAVYVFEPGKHKEFRIDYYPSNESTYLKNKGITLETLYCRIFNRTTKGDNKMSPMTIEISNPYNELNIKFLE